MDEKENESRWGGAETGPEGLTIYDLSLPGIIEDFFICKHCDVVIRCRELAMEHDEEIYCEECFNELFARCSHCDEIVPLEECRNYDDGQLCDDCYEEHFFTCDACGGVNHIDGVREVNDSFYCESCFNRNYLYCADCDQPTPRNDSWRVTGQSGRLQHICEECRDENYNECENCGAMHHMDNLTRDGGDNLVCPACANKHVECIHNYGYKPCPRFHGKGKLQHGVELEIDGGGRQVFVDSINRDELSKNENLFYLKDDGSLTEDGIEIVTNPATLDYHLNKFPWNELIKRAIKAGYTSHNNGHCGLHVHVSRDYFNDSELASMKLVYLFEKFWTEFVALSRRREFGYCSRPGELLSRNKMTINNMRQLKGKANDFGRYQAVNLIPDNTIEFRLWRGTLNLETIRATLELTDFLCVFVNSHSTIQLQKIAWPGIVEHAKKLGYKNMLKMIDQRITTCEV